MLLQVTLQPNYVFVKENQMAVYNCSYSCEVMRENSHGVFWHIGDVLDFRGFTSRMARKFTRKTGLYVEVEDLSTCDENRNGTIIHQLRINATSAARWNRTPVQCVAVSTNAKENDFYSPYGLLFITPEETHGKRSELY